MKKSLMIAVIVLLVLIAAAGAVYLIFFQNNKPEELSISSSLDFDDAADEAWLDLLPLEENGENLTPDAGYLFEGSLRTGPETGLGGANVKMGLQPGALVHVRIRASGAGPCFPVELFSPNGDGTTLRVSGCTFNTLGANLLLNQPDKTLGAPMPFKGMVTISPDEWLDIVFWYNTEGDAVFYFAGMDSDPNQFAYGAVSLPEEWQPNFWVVYFGGFYGGEEATSAMHIDADFVRFAYGPVTNYLYYNLPGYLTYQESVDAFMLEEPVLANTLDLEQH